MKKTSKFKDDPRISVNPLCEYVVEASASRRNSIIRNCKKPVTFITKWYNNAEDLLSFYLSEIRDDPKVLTVEISRLRTRFYGDDQEQKYGYASADALSSFLVNELSIRSEFAPYTLEMSVNSNKHKFIVNGVKISLRPELIVRDKSGKQQLGFVKFYFCKGESLSDRRAEYMAVLTKHYFEQEFGFTFKNQHCFVLDVYTGQLHVAPSASKRRLSDIEAACREIADRWDKVLV